MSADDNILRTIPGETLGAASLTLPDATTWPTNMLRAVVVLPDGRRAEVSYVRNTSKRGRSTRWFWTPVAAVLLEEEGE